jgi:hypothetical protein
MRLPAAALVVLAACHGSRSDGAPPAASVGGDAAAASAFVGTSAASASVGSSASVRPSASPVASGASPSEAGSTPSVRAVTAGATLEVRLAYTGKPPAPWPIAAPFAAHCGGAAQVPNPTLDVEARGGVTGAVVWLDDVPLPSEPTGSPPSIRRAHAGTVLDPKATDVVLDPKPREGVLDQKGCVFSPHVLAMTAGAMIDLTNGDPANHMVRLELLGGGDEDSTLKVLPPGGTDTLAVPPAWAGRVARISCPIHPWMLAWAHFFGHPYFAVTQGGVARLHDVPRGTWHLVVWHEALAASGGTPDASPGTAGASSAPPIQARFAVTVGDRDVVRALTLGEDGAIR